MKVSRHLAAAACVFAASSVNAAPVAINFSGELFSVWTQSGDPSLAAAFPVRTPINGTVVYQAGAELQDTTGQTAPGYVLTHKSAGGEDAVKSGQVTIGAGPTATTIRYERMNPDLPPGYAEFFAGFTPRVDIYEGYELAQNRASEQLTFGFGSGGVMLDGTFLSISQFSETNDQTGGYTPFSMTLTFSHVASFAQFERWGIADFDELPLDLSGYFAAVDSRVFSLNLYQGTALSNLGFVITSFSTAPLEQEVPEPVSLGLLGLGALALSAARRKRRRRNDRFGSGG